MKAAGRCGLRNRLICGLAFLFLAGCGQRVIDENQLRERDGIRYVAKETDPFTGRATRVYPNGQFGSEITFRRGKPHGRQRTWYWNGQMSREATVKFGKLVGTERTWHENGQLMSESTYKNGQRVECQAWDDYGTPEACR